MKKYYFSLTACSLIILLLQGCSDNVIDIGFSSTLSGKNSDIGIQCRNGVMLAVEEINSANILNNKKIKVHMKDDENNPQKAADSDTELADDGINIIIGHSTSDMSKAGYSAVAHRDVIMISPSSSSDYFTDRDDNFLRVCTTTKAEAISIGRNIIDNGYQRFAILYDSTNRTYSESYIGFLSSFLSDKNTKPLFIKDYNLAKREDMEAASTDVLNSGIQAVLVLFSAVDLMKFSQAVRTKKSSVHIFSGGWGMTGAIIQDGGKYTNGIKTVLFFNPEDNSRDFLEFKKKYYRRFGSEATFSSIYGYDCIYLLLESFKKGIYSPQGIKKNTIETVRFISPAGEILINRFGDTQRQSILVEIKNGTLVKSK